MTIFTYAVENIDKIVILNASIKCIISNQNHKAPLPEKSNKTNFTVHTTINYLSVMESPDFKTMF